MPPQCCLFIVVVVVVVEGADFGVVVSQNLVCSEYVSTVQVLYHMM